MTSPAAPRAAFSAYGLELEYMIVDGESLAVQPIADVLLDRLANAAKPAVPGFAWSNELVLHLLELKNVQPSAELEGLAQDFGAEVSRANETLAAFGARLMPTAMHPWMDPTIETRLWPHRDAAIYRTYDAIFGCRTHGWANIQSAQLNLPFAGDGEFARLHAAVRLLLPLLPALAASSPIAGGAVRERVDYRMECYRLHAARKPSLIGLVVPDNADSLADYQATVLGPMYADVAPLDPEGNLQKEWLNARGAIPRFDRHAIEIRVVDMQECPAADLAIAALASAATRALYDERWSSVDEQRGMTTQALAGILDACARDAENAIVDDARYLGLLGCAHSRCSAGDVWRGMLAACDDDPLLTETSRNGLSIIFEQGPLARRILRAVGRDPDRGRLTEVYRQLCDCLAEGRQFTRPA